MQGLHSEGAVVQCRGYTVRMRGVIQCTGATQQGVYAVRGLQWGGLYSEDEGGYTVQGLHSEGAVVQCRGYTVYRSYTATGLCSERSIQWGGLYSEVSIQ